MFSDSLFCKLIAILCVFQIFYLCGLFGSLSVIFATNIFGAEIRILYPTSENIVCECFGISLITGIDEIFLQAYRNRNYI